MAFAVPLGMPVISSLLLSLKLRFGLMLIFALSLQACSQLGDRDGIARTGQLSSGDQIGSGSSQTQCELPTILPPPVVEEMGEVGVIEALTDQELTIQFLRSYQQPVVIAKSLSFNGADVAHVRITNVTSQSMSLKIVEPSNAQGPGHQAERVSYIVLEAGVWRAYPMNQKFMAGVINTDANYAGTSGEVMPNYQDRWERVNFDDDFDGTPAVWAQVQTASSGPTYVQTRQRDVQANSFEVALQQERIARDPHPAENVGWVAMAPSLGEWSELPFEVRITGPEVDHLFTSVIFFQEFSTPPNLISGMQWTYGGNPSHLRHQGITTNSFEAFVEEDSTSLDPAIPQGTDHVKESIAYFAIEGSGILKATRAE